MRLIAAPVNDLSLDNTALFTDVVPPITTTREGRRRRSTAATEAGTAVGVTSSTGPAPAAAAEGVNPSANPAPGTTKATDVRPGKPPAEMAAAVAYRSAPARRTTLDLDIAPSCCATVSPMAAEPPSTTMRLGASRAISRRVELGNTVGVTNSNGPPSWAAAVPAAMASGYVVPLA